MSTVEQPDLSVKHPARRSMRYWQPDNATDFSFLGVAAAASLLGYVLFGRIGVIQVVLVAALLWLRPEQLDARIYVWIGQLFQDAWLRFVKKDKVWGGSSKFQILKTKPIALKAFELGDIGLLNNSKRRTDSIIVVGTGSDIAALSLAGQYGRNEQFAMACKRISAFSRFKIGLSYVHLRRPENVFDYHDFMRGNEHHEAMLPSALALGKPEAEWTDEDKRWINLTQVASDMTSIVESASASTMAWVVTLKRSRAVQLLERKTAVQARKDQAAVRKTGKITAKRARKALKSGISTAEEIEESEAIGSYDASDVQSLASDTSNVVAVNEVADFAISLMKGCGVSNARVLNVDEVEEFIRRMWDCDIEGYDSIKALDNMVRQAAEADDSDIAMEWVRLASGNNDVFDTTELSKPEHWMDSIEVGNDFVKFGNTYHSTIMVTSSPSTRFPDSARETFACDVPWFSQSMVGESVRGRLQYTLLNQLRQYTDTFEELLGTDSGPAGARRQGETMERLEELDRAQVTMDFNILATVSASSLEELRAKRGVVTRHYTECGYGTLVIKRRCRQVSYAITAFTGVDML